MLKRNAAVIVVAGLLLAGGAFAWAQGQPDRPEVDQGTAAQSPEERRARAEEFRRCMEAAGDDQEARRRCFEQFRPAGRRHHGPGILRRAVHGDVLVAGENNQFEELTFDKGTVEEGTNANQVVLKRRDGQVVTIQLTADTRYHGVQNAGELQEGKPAVVVSKDGKARTVAQRGDRPPRTGQPGNKTGAGDVPMS
jgi:hypothetical protein